MGTRRYHRPAIATLQSRAAVAIPFTLPSVEGREQLYVNQVLTGGRMAGDGPYTERCSRILESITGARRAMLTTSCTHALEMSAMLLEVGPGDEVIIPDFTFVSTVNAFVLRGATPVFADVRPDTLNLDERALERLITPRTKAIVVVHYGGTGCEMDAILAIAKRHGVAVVEDNAHGLFGTYRGRSLGSFGSLATLSFHETKNITCGEGGALLINDPALAERAEIVREKGTNRSRFFRGQVDKYTWVDIGSSYLLSDILAAVLLGQLEASDVIQRRRMEIWERYRRELAPWAMAADVQLPVVPDHCSHPAHVFFMLMPTAESRTRLIDHLRRRGVTAVFHYLPLHLSEMGRRLGGRAGDCPVTEDVSERLVRLPLYNRLSPADQGRVIEAVGEFQLVP